MSDLPSSIALANIADGANIVASDHRNNYSAVQAAVNLLIAAVGGGASKQFLQATDTDTVAWAGDFTAYVPTWSASGTAVALGNGTLTGRYLQIGKLVHFYIEWVAGSTTTFGTGTYSFSLPVNDGAPTNLPLGVGYGIDTSSGAAKYLTTILGTNVVFVQYPTDFVGGQAAVGQLTPWTWANGDSLRISGTYETA